MNRSFYLKSKVLLGFGFVLIAIMGASYVAYDSYIKLSEAVETISQPDTKLQQIDSIMYIVARSETSLQEYTISKSAAKLQKYDSQLTDIRQRVQQLKSTSVYDESELDSILSLINAKLVSMDDFIRIKERRDAFNLYDQALAQLRAGTSVKDTDSSTVRKNSSLDENGIPKKIEANKIDNEEEKKFLNRWRSRLGELFSKNKETVDTTSVAEVADSTVVDTSFANLSVDSIEQMLTKLKSEQRATEKALDRQELRYLSNNAQVMGRINELISKVKQGQQNNYQEQLAEARSILESSLSRLGFILLVALGSTFIFIYLIFSDIAKSDFLKVQLEKAKLSAEKLARVKEDFLANMSHEIRTPLTAILGFTGQLKKTKLGDEQKNYLSAVDSSSTHLLALVNDILDFSKIEAGQLKFEYQPFDIQSLVKQVNDDMRFQAEKKDLQLHWQINGEEFRYLKGDAFRLKQVLYNLISNAIKFTEEGGVIIRCKLKPMEQGLIKAQLEVVDTGIGIPAEKQSHIFEPFIQSDISDTRKYGGTGLGLSICKKIVESQGGEIALDSEVGEGSTFYVALPYEHSSQAAYEDYLRATQTVEGAHFPGSTVMAIDDDPLNTELLKLIMRKWSVTVHVAHSGEEALEALKHTKVDMVLTDLQMPGMHGEEVAQQIKSSALAHVPVVAFTARATENKRYFIEKGFSDVLLKPFQENEVYRLLEKYLKDFAVEAASDDVAEVQEVVASDSAQAEWYSLANISRFVGEDQEAMLGFLDSFTMVLSDSVAQIEQAIVEDDYETVAYHAHKLFPNVQQLQYDELAILLRRMENQAQQPAEGFNWEQSVEKAVSMGRKLLAALTERQELLKAQVS
ncbi:ATP-binding protein [Porifericola rhodea]|uniref:ATP-binding protein n=1 Tax=Porifericola rhodea TaxID=930972 RepID=UPI0026652E77|nr:ATP-binding protein [Porifericola rhodea]WKN31662.1 ATP-binding protein [Porifericola rhodea]